MGLTIIAFVVTASQYRKEQSPRKTWLTAQNEIHVEQGDIKSKCLSMNRAEEGKVKCNNP